jgi:hypothetical protein
MSTSPYLTAAEAAALLRFEYADGRPNVSAFRLWRWRHKNRLPAYKRGRVLLFRKVDLDLALEKEGAALAEFKRRVGA